MTVHSFDAPSRFASQDTPPLQVTSHCKGLKCKGEPSPYNSGLSQDVLKATHPRECCFFLLRQPYPCPRCLGLFCVCFLAQSWEHAITDVGIVFVDKGETVPPGWELISTTVRAKSRPAARSARLCKEKGLAIGTSCTANVGPLGGDARQLASAL